MLSHSAPRRTAASLGRIPRTARTVCNTRRTPLYTARRASCRMKTPPLLPLPPSVRPGRNAPRSAWRCRRPANGWPTFRVRTGRPARNELRSVGRRLRRAWTRSRPRIRLRRRHPIPNPHPSCRTSPRRWLGSSSCPRPRIRLRPRQHPNQPRRTSPRRWLGSSSRPRPRIRLRLRPRQHPNQPRRTSPRRWLGSSSRPRPRIRLRRHRHPIPNPIPSCRISARN